VVAARRVAQLIKGEEASAGFSVVTYDKLLAMHEREGRAMTSLAAKMRLNQSSTDDRRKTSKVSTHKKPWEFSPNGG
jgi:hypothetical protein